MKALPNQQAAEWANAAQQELRHVPPEYGEEIPVHRERPRQRCVTTWIITATEVSMKALPNQQAAEWVSVDPQELRRVLPEYGEEIPV
jgi:hypothetical protein